MGQILRSTSVVVAVTRREQLRLLLELSYMCMWVDKVAVTRRVAVQVGDRLAAAVVPRERRPRALPPQAIRRQRLPAPRPSGRVKRQLQRQKTEQQFSWCHSLVIGCFCTGYGRIAGCRRHQRLFGNPCRQKSSCRQFSFLTAFSMYKITLICCTNRHPIRRTNCCWRLSRELRF